jgi:hypothetical protein
MFQAKPLLMTERLCVCVCVCVCVCRGVCGQIGETRALHSAAVSQGQVAVLRAEAAEQRIRELVSEQQHERNTMQVSMAALAHLVALLHAPMSVKTWPV